MFFILPGRIPNIFSGQVEIPTPIKQMYTQKDRNETSCCYCRELEMLVDNLNAGRPQCPVGLNTLVVPRQALHSPKSCATTADPDAVEFQIFFFPVRTRQ
jgi:hypothetical protein